MLLVPCRVARSCRADRWGRLLRTLYQALKGARRSILIAAWQFDPHIELSPDAAGTLDWATENPGLVERLGFLRASLLAEHAGGVALEEFVPIDGLVRAIDARCDDPASRLTAGVVGAPDRAEPLVLVLFDPATVFDHQRWDRVLGRKPGARRAGVARALVGGGEAVVLDQVG